MVSPWKNNRKNNCWACFKPTFHKAPTTNSTATKPFAERSRGEVYDLVIERVVKFDVEETWLLWDSLTNSAEIKASVPVEQSGTELRFVVWANWDFLRRQQSSDPVLAGVRTAILGSLWTIGITILVAFPLGVMAAIYLEEYAADNWINRVIQTNINNLAGVPSIIYGILGLAIFVRVLEPFTSGTLFGITDPTTANGRTIMSAGLTLALLVLPLIIINSQEAIRAVPGSLRNASYGIGATKWQTVWSHVLPNCHPGHPDRHDPGHLARHRRDRAAGGDRRIHGHLLRPGKCLLQIHHPAHSNLPVDIPSTG